MMKIPVTPAVRVLRDKNVSFEAHLYKYQPKGGTSVSALELGVPEETVVKTLVFEDDCKSPLIVLMRGDLSVSTKNLARLLKVKTIAPCQVQIAQKHSGYMVGGTSPFGTKKSMPVYMEQSILDFEKVYINGGKRGFLVSLDPNEIVRVLSPTMVEVGVLD